jgi:hypothetical protein
MRSERSETGKVSSPGHAKGPCEHAPEGSLARRKPAAYPAADMEKAPRQTAGAMLTRTTAWSSWRQLR